MNDIKYNHYNLLASVLKYPNESLVEDTEKCWDFISQHYPQLQPDFFPFLDFVRENSLDKIEEVYTKTFHIQAVCYLDLGYVIFGEDYKRGEFLVNMKKEQLLANNDCGNELADNLVNVLTLIPLIKIDDFRNDLTSKIVIPALRKMLEEFTEHRMQIREKVIRKMQKAVLQEGLQYGNIYKHLLATILECFKTDFKEVVTNEVKVDPLYGREFIAGCGTCSTETAKKMVIDSIKE